MSSLSPLAWLVLAVCIIGVIFNISAQTGRPFAALVWLLIAIYIINRAIHKSEDSQDGAN